MNQCPTDHEREVNQEGGETTIPHRLRPELCAQPACRSDLEPAQRAAPHLGRHPPRGPRPPGSSDRCPPPQPAPARAFAALPELLETVTPLCGPHTRVLAMKGKRPDAEIAAVPPHWRVIETRALDVPGLNAERHVVILQKTS